MYKDAVVIPWYDSGCPHRKKAFDTVLQWWAESMPATPVYVGVGPTPNRGALRNNGALSAISDGKETLIFCDADIIPTVTGVQDIHRFLDEGLVYLYQRLWMTDVLGHQWPETGHLGGLFAVSSMMYRAVGGFPEFDAYGAEDVVFEVCVATLSEEETIRADADATHLYHPSGHRTFIGPQFDLCRQYESARGDKDAILKLIAERPVNAGSVRNGG